MADKMQSPQWQILIYLVIGSDGFIFSIIQFMQNENLPFVNIFVLLPLGQDPLNLNRTRTLFIRQV